MNSLPLPARQHGVNRLKSADLLTLKPLLTDYGQYYSLCRKLIFIASFLLLCLYSVAVEAAEQNVNKNWRSIAIKGYDPVAYFTMGKAVEGRSKFEFRWHDARWRFVSEEHRDMFAENPEKYAPRFGGYCAEGMAIGRKAPIDPHAWLIVDGELYLNFSKEVRDKMAHDPDETIGKADLVWEKLEAILGER